MEWLASLGGGLMRLLALGGGILLTYSLVAIYFNERPDLRFLIIGGGWAIMVLYYGLSLFVDLPFADYLSFAVFFVIVLIYTCIMFCIFSLLDGKYLIAVMLALAAIALDAWIVWKMDVGNTVAPEASKTPTAISQQQKRPASSDNIEIQGIDIMEIIKQSK